jgi:hypothetical protein
MSRGVYAAAAVAVALVSIATLQARAGNGWMMEKMADELNRTNEQAVRSVSPPASGRVDLEAAVKNVQNGSPKVRVIRNTVGVSADTRRLPQEKAETSGYVSFIRRARLDVPVVAAR